MTKDQVRKLRTDIQAILDQHSAGLGIKMTVGNATMGATVTFKLECATVLADGTVKTREAEDFKRYATAFGLKVDDLGRTIKYAGHQYVVKGLKPSASKFPVLADRDDGKRYCLPAVAARSGTSRASIRCTTSIPHGSRSMASASGRITRIWCREVRPRRMGRGFSNRENFDGIVSHCLA